MDYDKLIERLKNAAGGPEGIRMAQDAATAIETLRAENKKLRAGKNKAIESLSKIVKLAHEQRDAVIADLARVTAERDAATHDLELFATCDTCKFGEMEMAYDCLGCDHASRWKWRGIKED